MQHRRKKKSTNATFVQQNRSNTNGLKTLKRLVNQQTKCTGEYLSELNRVLLSSPSKAGRLSLRVRKMSYQREMKPHSIC